MPGHPWPTAPCACARRPGRRQSPTGAIFYSYGFARVSASSPPAAPKPSLTESAPKAFAWYLTNAAVLRLVSGDAKVAWHGGRSDEKGKDHPKARGRSQPSNSPTGQGRELPEPGDLCASGEDRGIAHRAWLIVLVWSQPAKIQANRVVPLRGDDGRTGIRPNRVGDTARAATARAMRFEVPACVRVCGQSVIPRGPFGGGRLSCGLRRRGSPCAGAPTSGSPRRVHRRRSIRAPDRATCGEWP